MKRFILFAGILAFALAASMPALALSWGDFVIVNNLYDTDVDFFLPPDTPSNPAPFAPPSALQAAATYPGLNQTSVMVEDFQDYLSNHGFATDTFGLKVTVLPESSVQFASMNISIGGVSAASSVGTLILSNLGQSDAAFYLLPKLNLSSYADTDNVLISYNTVNGYTNVDSISMAATPEPISMAFLSTGLLGTILYRVRRRRRI